MPKPFNGVINLDVRDSVADWDAFTATPAREGSPNVLVVLYDDTGCAAWEPYGGRIKMPTLQRLADNGLTYSQWHTTALCSPTRSTFLTGRNHHANGFASISESSTGFRATLAHPARERDDRPRPARRRLQHVLDRQEPQRPGRRLDPGLVQEGMAARHGLRPLLRLHRRRTTGIPILPRTTITSSSPTGRTRAITSPRTSPTRPCSSSATPSSPSPRSPGTCGSALAPITRPTTPRRRSSTSTRARSTTAMRRTASGCSRA